MERCPHCGTNLRKIQGELFCPNHGFIEMPDYQEEEKSDRSYIG